MTKSEFISLLSKPYSISETNVALLKELTKSFPYCQSAYILLAKATHENDSMHANQMLRKASVYATDRQILKKVIHLKAPVEKEEVKEVVPEDIKQSNTEIVDASKVSPQEEETVTKEVTKMETSTPSSTDDIIKELQETLENSKKIANELAIKKQQESLIQAAALLEEKKTVINPIEVEEEANSSLKKETEIGEYFSKEEEIALEKPDEKKKEVGTVSKSEEEILPSLPEKKLGYNFFSSRLGDFIEQESDYTSEYPFLSTEKNYIISAPKIKSQEDIVDEFIKKAHAIKRVKTAPSNEKIENLARKSIRKKKTPATETLAKLYASQQNKSRAKKIYEELILKNPEKRSYFAALIEQLEK